ncbi:CocE/NonD family hydrolase [Isobaculum melis]|uniref:Xaa-Pro dipeptidyl-peptidase C-terminal domain-containing protein n=1 Tax=Isobaculum melis TaxID=142588 RepID=A0A1H9SSM7_9LACT|nr:CocE/NonD family hydrolase [Isobaculum melis]SER88010.1 hypothetical protein SAMN04488559_10912 [Isobaculum melis]
MAEYQLIQFGVIQAYFKIQKGQKTQIKMLTVETGQLGDYRFITEADAHYFTTSLKYPLADLLERMAQLQSYPFSPTEQKLTTDWQGVYHRLDEQLWVEREKKFPMDIWTVNQQFRGVILPNSQKISFLMEVGYPQHPLLAEWEKSVPKIIKEHPYGIQFQQSELVPMRDGVHLSTCVMLPSKGTHFPVIFMRTPYGKEEAMIAHYPYVQLGYAVVLQDVRGRNLSEGDPYIPKIYDQPDGDDTLNWIAAQEWCNGEIGMIGASYGGYVQWAAAASGNPHLKAMVSIVTAGSPFVDLPRKGGTFTSGGIALNFGLASKKFDRTKLMRDDWDELIKIRPIQDIPVKGLGFRIPFVEEQLQHPAYDTFWGKANWHAKKEQIQAPAMVVSGWYDDNYGGTTEALDVVADYPRDKCKIILGPWLHNGNTNRDICGISMGDKAIRHDLDLQYIKWLNHFLMGEENGITAEKSVDYYTIGAGEWKQAETWPPTNIQLETLYFQSNGQANSDIQAGQLVTQQSDTNEVDHYLYDPENPTPHLIDLSENELSCPDDYATVELRPDVLTYTTAPFATAKTVTGSATISFYASSTAVDTDWVVRLCEVTPEGKSIKLADGFLGATFRESFTEPSLLTPNQVYLYEIETARISAEIQAGHALRVSITSSAANYIFPNSNTAEGFNSGINLVAEQTIYHNQQYPSKVVIPIEKD